MRTLVLGDMHLPYPDYELLYQARDFNKVYRADRIICVGDLTDQKGWSSYTKDTDDPGSDAEWDLVVEAANKAAVYFPKLQSLLGNHDIRYLKKANEVGIPSQMLRSLKEALPVKNWTWHTEDEPLEIDGVLYLHGDEDAGNVEAKAALLGQPVVQGHTHKARIVYLSTPKRKHIWGMDVACTADVKSKAFRYSKRMLRKAMGAFATVTDRVPHLYPKA